MKKLYIIAFLFLASCGSGPDQVASPKAFAATLAAGIQLTFTQMTADFNRPGAGANEWSYDQNIVNIPTQGTNTQRLDRYWRFMWTDFQPFNGAAGSMDFTVFDQKIQQSITKGQTFSFGIMQVCTGCDANLKGTAGGSRLIYPLWLHNQMQAESVKDFVSSDWFPNYNSPSYLAAVKARNVAINNHILNGSFNGVRYQDVIGQIDIRDYGDFGEWTNNVFTVGNITVPTGDSIISYNVHVFAKFQCVYMMATVDGGQLSNTNVPPAVGYYALTTSNSVGKLGWRRDSWGQTDNYLSQWTDTNPTTFNGLSFKTEIMNRYKTAPVVGEPQDGGSAGNFPDLPNQMKKYGTTSFGNGNFNGSVNATIQNNFRAASAVAGYKLTLTAGSISGNLISLSWQNVNTAPAYRTWNVTYELRTGSTVQWTSKSSFNPYLFTGSKTTVDSLPNGTGDLYLVIRDPLKFRKPMPLAITGQNADGSYLLKAGVTLSGGSSPPPVDTVVIPNPPVDTTIVPPPDTTHPKPPVNCDTTIKVKYDSSYKVSHDTTIHKTKDSLIHRTCGGTVPPVGSTVSVFTTQVPTAAAARDNSTGIEVGMNFTASTAGTVTAIKFYKQAANTGTHTGSLYDGSGNKLASVTFTNETATGWQTMPVNIAIAAGPYTVSVYSSAGWYSYDNTGFKTPVKNGVLTGTKGVYIYGQGYPTSTYQQSNYFVDVQMKN